MDWMKLLKVGAGVSAVSFALTWLYGSILKFLGTSIATISFAAIDVNVGQRLSAGIDTSLAGKYLGTLIGSVPIGFQTLILLFVSSVLIVGVGHWFNKSTFDLGKSANTKFAFDLTFGSLIVGAAVGFMSGTFSIGLGWLGTAFATGIYFLIVALAYSGLRMIDALKGVLATPQE